MPTQGMASCQHLLDYARCTFGPASFSSLEIRRHPRPIVHHNPQGRESSADAAEFDEDAQ